MKSKIIKYSVLFVTSAALIFLLLTRQKAPFGGENSSFAVDPGAIITSIELSDGDSRLKLAKDGDSWLVNDKFEARKSSILFIQQILKGLKIKSPVSEKLFSDEISEKNIKPVRVKVFENRRLIKSFYVYKTNSNLYGNIMKLRERSKPFILFVPGNDTEIGSAFTLKELFWQSYTVFNLLPSQIVSVTLESYSDTASSFHVANNNFRFSLSANGNELTGWDTSRVVRYLSYFVHIPFESWDFSFDKEKKEKLLKSEPAYTIEVIKNSGEKTVLTVWERILNDEGKTRKDTDRLWAKTESSDEIFIIRYLDIDPLLKKRSYFFSR